MSGWRSGRAATIAGLWIAIAPWVTSLADGEEGTGGIVGVVRMATPPPRSMVKVTADQAVCGNEVRDESIVAGAAGGVANAVVVVQGVPWPNEPPPAVINNKGCLFAPRVQVARPREPVFVTSEDNTLHTTHVYDERNRALFNIALPVPGLKIQRPMPLGGVMRIECDSHEWMRGWLYVTDLLATVTGPGGRFRLEGIPAGTHELTVWHERLEVSPQPVVVSAGSMTEVVLTLQ